MSSKSRLFVFLLTLLLLAIAQIIFVSAADPYRVFNKSWIMKTETHLNFYLNKFELIEKSESVETLILGSSTSENFYPQDVETLYGGKVFHGSVAGSQTVGRMVLLVKALDQFKGLKRIIYISDFYEFNDDYKDFLEPLVYDNKKLRSHLSESSLSWESFDFEKIFWQYFSQVTFEKSVNQTFKKVTGKEKIIYSYSGGKIENEKAAGEKADPQILIGAKKLVETNNQPLGNWLKAKIVESLNEYQQGVLKEFRYSQRAEVLYREAIEKAQERGVELLIISSPYHPEFKKEIFRDPNMERSYERWLSFLQSLNNPPQGVRVHLVKEPQQSFPDYKPWWRDGVHYSREASKILLFQSK